MSKVRPEKVIQLARAIQRAWDETWSLLIHNLPDAPKVQTLNLSPLTLEESYGGPKAQTSSRIGAHQLDDLRRSIVAEWAQRINFSPATRAERGHCGSSAAFRIRRHPMPSLPQDYSNPQETL